MFNTLVSDDAPAATAAERPVVAVLGRVWAQGGLYVLAEPYRRALLGLSVRAQDL